MIQAANFIQKLLLCFKCVKNGPNIKSYSETPAYFIFTNSFPLVPCFDLNLKKYFTLHISKLHTAAAVSIWIN